MVSLKSVQEEVKVILFKILPAKSAYKLLVICLAQKAKGGHGGTGHSRYLEHLNLVLARHSREAQSNNTNWLKCLIFAHGINSIRKKNR